ncbi:MAG: type II secretion system F family protein [Chloroflexi bacterium]|nr:type II secretion system F family protein [Chloroflexota bacterium]
MEAQLLEVGAVGTAAAGAAAVAAGAYHALRWQLINRRIRRFVAGDRPAVPVPLSPSAGAERADAGTQFAASLNRRLTRSSLGATAQLSITRAGLALKPSELILLQIAAACAAAILGFLLLPRVPDALRFAIAAGVGLLGFLAPLFALHQRARSRQKQFEKQLPPAIDSMAGTLQAGSTLPQAMEIIAREMHPPISREFRRVLREVELGLSFTDALANLVHRLPSSDLLLVTSAISIQNRVGGDLAEILRSIAHTVRERLRIRGEINVLTAQGRYSAYIITALPILLFLYLYFTKYDYIAQLFLPGLPRMLLIGGIAGIALGYFSMKKIVAIDV